MPRYQLSILAENLPRGTFGRPNPYAKVVVSGGPREGETIGQTETLESTQDADFLKIPAANTGIECQTVLHEDDRTLE